MALEFGVQADYSELARLEQEIQRLENKLRSFGPGESINTIKAVEAQLASARRQFSLLSVSAADAGAKIEQNIRRGAQGAMNALSELQRAVSNPLEGLGMMAGVAGLGAFLNQIKDVRAEFEQMETAINVLVGETKGKTLMQQLTDFAKVSPLDFKGTVGGAQMMLGFGLDVEKIPRYLSAIGDVSMGNAQRFQSLTLAFSQMSAAGKLMGQDLLKSVA